MDSPWLVVGKAKRSPRDVEEFLEAFNEPQANPKSQKMRCFVGTRRKKFPSVSDLKFRETVLLREHGIQIGDPECASLVRALNRWLSREFRQETRIVLSVLSFLYRAAYEKECDSCYVPLLPHAKDDLPPPPSGTNSDVFFFRALLRSFMDRQRRLPVGAKVVFALPMLDKTCPNGIPDGWKVRARDVEVLDLRRKALCGVLRGSNRRVAMRDVYMRCPKPVAKAIKHGMQL